MSLASRRTISTSRLVVTGLVICLLLAAVVSLWASSHPDGLEFVAERLGFSQDENAVIDQALLSGGTGAVVGLAVVALIAFGLMHLLRRRGPRDDA